MDEIETGVLKACLEYGARQKEMLPQLAVALGVENSQVFYTWALRRCAQRGRLANADWVYFFHGLECDLRNQNDGRFLRIDFGPGGRVGVLNDGGVLRLILTSVQPWREFPNLKAYFAKKGPPFDEFSGDWEKMSEIWDALESNGFFEQAAPDLVAFQAKYTSRGPDGLNHVRYPPETTEQTCVDCSVAHRQQLSQKAVQFLKSQTQNGTLLVESSVPRQPDAGQTHPALK